MMWSRNMQCDNKITCTHQRKYILKPDIDVLSNSSSTLFEGQIVPKHVPLKQSGKKSVKHDIGHLEESRVLNPWRGVIQKPLTQGDGHQKNNQTTS
jgi:hypothetical protein